MRPRLLPALAALLVAACSAESLPSTTTAHPASTVPATITASTTSTAAPADGITTSTTQPAADAAHLAAIVLFPEDLPARFADLPLDPAGTGFRPAGASLSSALDPDDEADDIVRFGLLGDFTATYGSTRGLWIALEAVAFADPGGAAGYLADWQDDLARGAAVGDDLISFSPAPDDTAADEAVRAAYSIAAADPAAPAYRGVVRVVRAGATLAWVWAVGDDPEAAVDAIAPLVEGRLLGVLAGELPTRDPAILGLDPPPTALLDSFAFEYSYGIEAEPVNAGFRVDVTGEFRGPDRTSCRVAFAVGDEEEVVSRLVAVGTRVWLEGLTGYEEVPLRHPAALSDLPLCPGHPLFWEDTGYHRLPDAAGAIDSIDGLEVLRSDLAADPLALEALGYSPARAARITRYEVSRAVDGGWVVEIVVEEKATLTAARDLFGLPALAGTGDLPATIFTRLRLSRPNDPSIVVQPPLTAG